MRVQAFLTAMAVNLKRLAAALALFLAVATGLLASSAGQHDAEHAEAAGRPDKPRRRTKIDTPAAKVSAWLGPPTRAADGG